jgi:hypothetical protein
MIDTIDEQLLQELQDLIQCVITAETDNLSEIVKIARLNPAEDFAGAESEKYQPQGCNPG